MRIHIDKLQLASFTSTFYTNQFTYSQVEGKADCLGWNIIFFSEKGTNKVSAISFEDILTSQTITQIANKILQSINFPVQFKDSFSLIKQKFAQPNFTDNILENITRHYYIYKKEQLLLCFNTDNKAQLCGLEIITNQNIINNRLEVLQQ